MIMRSPEPFVRLELFFRLAYNIAARQSFGVSDHHIRDLPFAPTSKVIESTLFQRHFPATLGNYLWSKWRDLTSRTTKSMMDGVLPTFCLPNNMLRVADKKLTPSQYTAHFIEALRHSTHGFDSRLVDKTILFTHTGEIPDDLPYIAFFWWIAILSDPKWLFQ